MHAKELSPKFALIKVSLALLLLWGVATQASQPRLTEKSLDAFYESDFASLADILVADRQLIEIAMSDAQLQSFEDKMHLSYGYAYNIVVSSKSDNTKQRVVTITSRYSPKDFKTLYENAIKLSDLNLTPEQFTYHLTELINIHFARPYRDDPYRFAAEWGMTVQRPNHSTAHGVRQGKLAVDIVKLAHKHPDQFLPTVSAFVEKKYREDPTFERKVEFVSAFQRTGRESEAGFNSNPLSPYRNYGRSDVEFFKQAARASRLFSDPEDLNAYAAALNSAAQNMGKDNPLGMILFAAHTLDLRRMTWYRWNNGIQHLEHTLTTDPKIIDELAAKADKYLRKTGAWYPHMPKGELGPLDAGMYSKKWFELHQPAHLRDLAASVQ